MSGALVKLSRILGETFFSMDALRYGGYIAKLALVPVGAAQRALAEQHVAVDGDNDPNALCTASVGFLNQHEAEFEVRIPLCTDLDTMPVEDANTEWSEADGPYQPLEEPTSIDAVPA